MNKTGDDLMQHLESNLALLFRGPTFHPLSPAPLAPAASPDVAPAVLSAEEPA